jgi:hypothetical protein
MGSLIERMGLRSLVDGGDLSEDFKNNSLYFYEQWRKSDNSIRAIDVKDIQPGGFYHFHYLDDSNWMKWSPVFCTSFKKVGNKIILFCVNFNFIPLEIRGIIFDKFIVEEDFEKDKFLKVDYEGMYSELRKFGFEYSLVEYDVSRIKLCHKLSMEMVPRFLISAHPQNKYDPKKLFQIWSVKTKTSEKRNDEIMKSNLAEFYDISGEIKDKYKVLKAHIERLRYNMQKYARIK